MKLSDIKGEKALDVMADAMELAEALGSDQRASALMDDMRGAAGEGGSVDGDEAVRVFLKHVPALLRDPAYKSRIVSIMAAASGVDPEGYAADGPVLQDLLELITSDASSLGFLFGRAVRKG